MLQLKDESLIGSGQHRNCYKHPTDQHVCVKIVVTAMPRLLAICGSVSPSLMYCKVNW